MRLVAVIQGEKKIFSLRDGSTIMGRSEGCRIVIPVRGVSRQHAQCFVDQGKVVIRDLESSHGLYVNGRRVPEAALEDGDVIGLGSFELKFEAGGLAEPTLVEATPIDEETAEDRAAESPEEDQDRRWDEESKEEKEEAPAGDEAKDSEKESEPFVEDAPAADEDTPVDLQFAPQKYEPQAAPVGGPQLFQKDGRWFLKDPATGREVEIIPKGGKGAEAAPPPPSETDAARNARRRRTRLAIVAMAPVVIILLLVAVSRLFQDKPQQRRSDTITADMKARYNKAIDQGIDYLEAGKIDDAHKAFVLADRSISPYQVAGVFVDIIRATKESVVDEDRLKGLYTEVRNSAHATPKAVVYANQEIERIEKEEWHAGIVVAAQKLMRAGKHEEAYKTFLTLPEDSRARKAVAEDIRQCAQKCKENYLNLAREAQTTQDWDKVIRMLNRAYTYAPQSELKAIEDQIELCRKWKEDEEAVKKADEAFKNNNLSMVEPLLSNVSKESPYSIQKEQILRNVKNQLDGQAAADKAVKAKGLYAAGKGVEALRLIDSGDIAISQQEAEKIRRVTEAWKSAEEAYANKDYEKARDGWNLVINLEKDTENSYHQQAQLRLQEFEERRAEIAKDFNQKGDKAFGERKYQPARDFYRKAMVLDPEGLLGKRAIENLDNMARKKWAEAMVSFQKGDKETARKLFQEVLELAEKGSRIYNEAQQKLQELGDAATKP